ncbi:MAG TPA: hypothetical protein PK156_39575, partial [Polyangium sp.]|nr:hypothetical protein [Polyangium sp.]
LFTKEGIDADAVRFVQTAETQPAQPESIQAQPIPKPQSPNPRFYVRGLLGFLLAAFVVLSIFIAWPLHLPSMSPGNRSIVVVGPGGFRFAGRGIAENLCNALDRNAHDDEPRAICHNRGFGDNEKTVRDKALQAKASVLVVVDDIGVSQVELLGSLAGHDRLAHGWPRVDLSKSGATDSLAPVLHELARAADGANDGAFDKSRLRCGESVVEEPFGVALAIMVLRLYVPNCLSIDTDIDALRPRCHGEECQILALLVPKSVPAPDDCDNESDAAKQLACMRKQAVDSCETTEKKSAQSWLNRLDAVPNPFYRITASEIAACIIAHGSDLSSEEKTALELRADKPEPDCESSACAAIEGQCMFCAFAISERARYWAQATDWKRAERDYERAFRTSRNTEHLLGLVASRLHRFKDIAGDELARKTAADLKAMGSAEAKQKLRARLLAWVAAKREGNETYVSAAEISLLEAYGELAVGEPVYSRETPDEMERSLLCPRQAKNCPIYDFLAVPKVAGPADKLRQMLRGAVQPEE